MNTYTFSPIKFITRSSLLLLFFVAACKSKDSKEQNNATQLPAEVNAPKIDIHSAIVVNDLNAVKEYISKGNDLNEKDPYGGSSPLITAALFDRPEMLILLLDAGADINFRNNDESTALHAAAFFCHADIVRLLIGKGADKTIKNKFNATAYETVAGPFSEAKISYDVMGKMLAPMGMKLDYAFLEKTRPEIAAMLK